jgi:lysophospholipid acyltransferase 1/2
MILCGPFCFYKDYITFIDGSHYLSAEQKALMAGSKSREEMPPPPCPYSSLKMYGIIVVLCGAVTVIQPMFSCSFLLEPAFRDSCICYKMFYIMLATSLARPKYYFAWKLSEAVNTCAGLGFNGYDEKGHAKWDLIDNADIYNVEMSTSLKVLLDNWNKMTTQWLRYVVYERYHSTLAVFLFSAFWHGFYGGYYLTFVGGAIFVQASRQVRRHIRPMFQSTAQKAFLYDVLTFITTRVTIAYLTFPFVMLQFWHSIEVYGYLYYWMHIVTILTIVGLTFAPPASLAKVDPQHVKQS